MANLGDARKGSEQAPKDLIGFLDFYLVKKAPFQIPDAGREWLVKFGPWIALVLLVLSLPAVLIVFGIGAALLPFAGLGYAGGFGLAAILFVVHVILLVLALPGLFARKMSAWRLVFYSQLVSITGNLLYGAVLSAIVGALIGLYLLFQIRSLYHE